MIKANKRFPITILFAVFLLLLGAMAAYAEGENADQPGESGKKPLYFSSVTLDGGGSVSGSADIPLQPKFVVTFDKNVVNATVWENNSRCFSLSADGGAIIGLSVSKIDDTVDSTKKHLIFVEPISPLTPGTSYQLRIAPQLQAKNGVSTLGGTTGGQGITVAFKTQGHAPAPPPPPQEKAVVTPSEAKPLSPPAVDSSEDKSDTVPSVKAGSAAAQQEKQAANPTTSLPKDRPKDQAKIEVKKSKTSGESKEPRSNNLLGLKNLKTYTPYMIVAIWLAYEAIRFMRRKRSAPKT